MTIIKIILHYFKKGLGSQGWKWLNELKNIKIVIYPMQTKNFVDYFVLK